MKTRTTAKIFFFLGLIQIPSWVLNLIHPSVLHPVLSYFVATCSAFTAGFCFNGAFVAYLQSLIEGLHE